MQFNIFFGFLLVILSFSFSANCADSLVKTRTIIKPLEVMIPMSDGVHLAADIYLPANMKSGNKYPVLLEYIPYRKNESRGFRHGIYSYFVKRGYVVARVDIRGTGRSEGRVIPYEYSDIELDDGETLIAWLAKQHWSSGKVGMFGISWGGFNSIQMAVRQPPALKAFIAIMATEALYQEDVHYIDGIIHTDSWMMSNDLYNSLPGAPEFKLDYDWFNNRFNVKPSIFTYMRHQLDSAFWDRASTLDKYDKIKIPGFHIGGWYDGYRDSLPRMLENVNAPVKAMIGPWDHDFPHDAGHSPRMEWRHEAVRWFDHWLKGIDTGIMDEPAFAVFVRDWHPPQSDIEKIQGKWRWEEGWPVKRSGKKTLYATPTHGLSAKTAKKATHNLDYKASVGLQGGGPVMWWGSVPPDQQPMDDHSLVYDSQPLDGAMEILGFPRALLNVSADAKHANWVVRISDVAPDGRVTQVGGAAFNGTHRHSAREPKYLPVDNVFPLEIEIHFTSWVFPKGHRIRLAISNAMWPMLWPTPYPMTTALVIGGHSGARIELPVIPAEIRPVPKFLPPESDPSVPGFGSIDSGNVTGYAEITSIAHDEKSGAAFGIASNSTLYRYPWGTEQFIERLEHRTSDKNPARTSVVGNYAIINALKDRTIRLEQDVEFKSDPKNFIMLFKRRIKVNGKVQHEKQWQEIFPRDFQ